MKLSWLLVSLCFALAQTSELLAKASPQVNPAAQKIWLELAGVTWDKTIQEWVSPGSIGTGLECRENLGNSYDTSADTEWSFRCDWSDPSHSSKWFFYVLPDGPLACRLERFELTASSFPLPVLEAIFNSVDAQISERFGPGREPERKYGGYGEFKSAAWQRVRLWETGDFQVKLYILHGPSDRPTLGLLARHRHLVEAINREKGRPYWWKWGPWTAEFGNPADRRLAAELDGDFPGIGKMLLEAPKGNTNRIAPGEVLRFLKALLVKARESPPEHRTALLLAANRLAEKLVPAPEADSVKGRVHKKIGGFELNYVWNHLGSSWSYQEDLLWLLWKEHSTSVWGEMAFVMLLSRGWNTTVGCGSKGLSDDFRQVIREAEKFLVNHPQSPFHRDVSLMLAQAYETWWSLSRASVQDSYANRFAYFDGAEEARKKAITIYEALLKSEPAGYEASYARQHLPRLRMGLDTNQRRFFCIYD